MVQTLHTIGPQMIFEQQHVMICCVSPEQGSKREAEAILWSFVLFTQNSISNPLSHH